MCCCCFSYFCALSLLFLTICLAPCIFIITIIIIILFQKQITFSDSIKVIRLRIILIRMENGLVILRLISLWAFWIIDSVAIRICCCCCCCCRHAACVFLYRFILDGHRRRRLRHRKMRHNGAIALNACMRTWSNRLIEPMFLFSSPLISFAHCFLHVSCEVFLSLSLFRRRVVTLPIINCHHFMVISISLCVCVHRFGLSIFQHLCKHNKIVQSFWHIKLVFVAMTNVICR